jgi:hypothetical protein
VACLISFDCFSNSIIAQDNLHELQALKRLDAQARLLERTASGRSLEAYMASEREASPSLDGRSVFGWEKDIARRDKAG